MPVKKINRLKPGKGNFFNDSQQFRIEYDVGSVGVEVDHSHKNKLILMKMTMENWAHKKDKDHPMDSPKGRMYEDDLHKVNGLLNEAELEEPKDHFLTKKDMQYLNVIFKTYGGKKLKFYGEEDELSTCGTST